MSTLSQFSGGGIKSIQRGTISLTPTIASSTATIQAVNTSKTMLNFVGASGSINSARISLTNSTTVTADGFVSSGTASVGYEVVEFY